MSPNYLHILIGHWPVIGSICAAMPLLYGILRGDRRLIGISLIIVVLSTILVVPLQDSGSSAFEETKQELVSEKDTPGIRKTTLDMIERHKLLGMKAKFGSLIVASSALLAIVSLFIIPSLFFPLSCLVLLLVLLNTAVLGLVSEFGIRISHTGLRDHPIILAPLEHYIP